MYLYICICSNTCICLFQKDYENLLEVKLDGCFLITNAGIKWLSDVIQGAKNLKKVLVLVIDLKYAMITPLPCS